MTDKGSASNPVVLITGTSTGIGLATALAAARSGFTTVATMRDVGRATELRTAAAAEDMDIDVRALDVTDADSIRACIDGILATYGRIDALVNNAGAAHVGTIELGSVEDVRTVFEVNFFGVVAMTRAVLPHLRATRGRIVTVSSVGGIVGQPFNEAYCAAKFAVEGFMESLAPVARSVGVMVCVVEPGAVASSFVANAGLDPDAMVSAAGPYAPAMSAYLARTRAQFANAAQPAHEVGAAIVHLLTDDDPPFRSQTSGAASAFVGLTLADLDGSAVQGTTRAWVSPSG